MLGESEVLCNGRGHGESVSMAECSDTAGIRSAAHTAWDSDDRRGRVWRETGNDGYAAWLGKRHREEVWGQVFTNAMVVGIRLVLSIVEGE